MWPPPGVVSNHDLQNTPEDHRDTACQKEGCTTKMYIHCMLAEPSQPQCCLPGTPEHSSWLGHC